MLGERVQHMHVYIARHKVPNQLNFPFMVCRGNGTHTKKDGRKMQVRERWRRRRLKVKWKKKKSQKSSACIIPIKQREPRIISTRLTH